jgi:hypothetical protein
MAEVVQEIDQETVVARLSKRLVGDMVRNYPRRKPGSHEIEAHLADEVRDAIRLIERQARQLRGLDEDRAKLLERLRQAEDKLKAV